jgi:ligand-binding sensor domain-containing protein/signal transduction histidine kinase
VVAILQSRDGYLWLATQEGLARFDGVKFTVFDKRNTPEIRDNNIQAMCQGRDGAIWIGTEGGGLTVLKDSLFRTYTSKDGLPSDFIDAVCEDSGGNLWVGTDAGLSRFSNGRFANFSTRDGLVNPSVLALLEDTRGALWVGTEAGLSRFDNGVFTTFRKKDGLPDDLIRSIYQDSEGNTWLGTGRGLAKIRDGIFSTYDRRQGLINDSINCTFEDRDHNLWIGTGGGIEKLRDGRVTHFSAGHGLPDDGIASIYQDREGSLWIGTYGGGLNRLKDARFTSLTVDDGLPDNTARAILQDHEGNIWVATRKGLSKLRDGKPAIFTTRNGLASDNVLSLYEDRRLRLWVGTAGGLSMLKDGRFVSYTTKDGLSDDQILSMAEDDEGSLWIGTAVGLDRLEGGKFTVYKTEAGLSNNSVWCLHKDRAGSLWIGTDGGGLDQFKDNRFHNFSTKHGLSNNIVMSIHEDDDGTLWVGTTGGLNRIREGTVASITAKNGLFDDVVFQLLADNIGNFWMSCNRGIFRARRKDLNDLADGRTTSIDCTSYDTSDGMGSRECNGGSQPAGWKAKDGRLWFPTAGGVTMIDPAKIKINDQPPSVVLERIAVDGHFIDPAKDAELGPGKEKFEFYFTGLSFLSPERVRFRYRLVGFDKEWIDGGTRRDASYTNLLPGRYTFDVIACNGDGLWNETGAIFSFRLRPRFYQTYWFYAACALIIAAVGWLLYRLRVRQIRGRFAVVLAERTRMAREIHDTLAQGYVGISLQLQALAGKLKDSPEDVRSHLDLASKMADTSLTEAYRSIWELRPQALEGGDLAGAISSVAEQMLVGTSVRLDVRVRGSFTGLPAAVEVNLLRICQEAVANAVKHAAPRRITIRLTREKGQVRLQVADDGKGFESTKPPSADIGRFGLISMRERANQIGGRLTVSSKPGHGTDVEVEVPAG